MSRLGHDGLPSIRHWLFSNQAHTNAERATRALVCGLAIVVLGVPVAADLFATGQGFYGLPLGQIVGQLLGMWLLGVFIAIAPASLVFLIAAFGWWGLDRRLKVRSPAAAAAYGAILASLPLMLIVETFSLAWAAFGSVIGVIVWVLAYRAPKAP